MLLRRLEIRNMRKIKQAEIDFHGPGVQVIEGINQSGKTTIGQAIAITMNGPKDFTPGMIARGEEEAEIIAYTDDELKIRTVVAGNVKQSVARYDESLGRHVNVSGGVRTFLDSICSGLEQPWALRDIPDADIVEMLMERSGTTEKIAVIDAELADKERLRTETGRDRNRLGVSGEAPDEVQRPDPIDNIKAEMELVQRYIRRSRETIDNVTGQIRESLARVTDIQALESIKAEIDQGITYILDVQTGISKKPYTQADMARLEAKISAWHDQERRAMVYDDYLKKKQEIEGLSAQYDRLTGEIESLRGERRKALADMKLRVSGLEIGEDNMLYHNGVLRGITKTNKTSNWSAAESVGVFFSLGARFAGKMKVLVVDNAESLDAQTTGTITQWAEKSGFLVIMLRVAEVPEELEEGVIYIREGEVLTK